MKNQKDLYKFVKEVISNGGIITEEQKEELRKECTEEQIEYIEKTISFTNMRVLTDFEHTALENAFVKSLRSSPKYSNWK